MNAIPFPTLPKLPRMLRFAVVGSIVTAIDVGLFTSLHAVAGIPSIPANIAAFGAGIVNNYILHRRWTYAGLSRRSAGEQAILFLAISLIALAIITLLVLLGERILSPFVAALVASPSIKAAATGIGLCWNNLANTYIPFRPSSIGATR
jgi:putative flippase GtrA